MTSIPVRWPDGRITHETIGEDWLVAASGAGISIPTGCLGGSCCLLYTSPSPRDG